MKMRQEIAKREQADLKDIFDIIRGHEIWLEYDKPKIRIGENVGCKLGFGHNMKTERAINIERVNAKLFNPQNEQHDLDLDVRSTYLITSFTPDQEGYYTVVVEYNAGILDLPHAREPMYYCQYTKAIIAVEHTSEEYKLITGQELEIIPLNFKQYLTGEKVVLQVIYDGRALPEAVVSAICSNCENPIETKTDSKGKATIKLTKDGNWMFMVRYKDPGKGISELYNEKAMTATYTIIGVHGDSSKEL